jgi:hypothetical protein
MPIISYFFGIIIRMYHDDHNPPHIHVEYQGSLPKKAAKIVAEWCFEHKEELIQDWELAITLQPLFRIPGADND